MLGRLLFDNTFWGRRVVGPMWKRVLCRIRTHGTVVGRLFLWGAGLDKFLSGVCRRCFPQIRRDGEKRNGGGASRIRRDPFFGKFPVRAQKRRIQNHGLYQP